MMLNRVGSRIVSVMLLLAILPMSGCIMEAFGLASVMGQSF